MAYPAPLERLIESFERFPGVGRRTAERLAFHVLRDPEARRLADDIRAATAGTSRCGICGNVTERDPCQICSDPERDARTVLVVEEPRDVEAVERAGVYAGRYHVLMGSLQPAEGVHERHLALDSLLARLRDGSVDELILGTDPDAEGEATGLLVLREVDTLEQPLRVTRLARGLPAGSALEYLHKGVLEDALEGRVPLRHGRARD